MKIFHIDEDVFRMLPDYYVGVVAAEGLVNRQDNPAVADRLLFLFFYRLSIIQGCQ